MQLRSTLITLGGVVAAAAAISATVRPGTAGAGPARLPRLDSVTVSDMNDLGQVVGNLGKSHGGGRGFLWDQGTLRVLGRGGFADASRINDFSQILGTTGSDEHTVLWDTRGARALPFGGDLNERGQVLGELRLVPNGSAAASAPALWTNGAIQLLPFAGEHPTAMNDLGQVVGQTTDDHAAEWQDGKLTDLGPGSPIAINNQGDILGSLGEDVILWHNGAPTDIGPGTPVALNEHGQVVGTYPIEGARGKLGDHAFLWSNGTMTDLGTLGGGTSSTPTAISDSGQVVGYSTDYGGVQHAFVWQNGTMTRLPSPKGYKGARTRAIAINDHNQIIGDNCIWYCGEVRSIRHPSRFAVLWTLRGDKIETRRLVDIRR